MVSTAAVAANPKATALAREAEQHYKAAQFGEAAQSLQQAYDLEPKGHFLFNLARALEQDGKTATAIETYRRYLALPADETEPELVARAKTTIAVRTQRQAPVKTKVSPGLTATPTRPGSAKGKNKPDAETEGEALATLPTAGPSPKLPGLLVAGGSVAAFAVGVTFGLLANGSRRSFDNAGTQQAKAFFEQTVRTKALVADICFAVGALTAITAVILLLRSDDGVAVALAPIPQGAVFAMGWRF